MGGCFSLCLDYNIFLSSLSFKNYFLTTYGLCPIAPSSVRVSPLIYLKSGDAICTHNQKNDPITELTDFRA